MNNRECPTGMTPGSRGQLRPGLARGTNNAIGVACFFTVMTVAEGGGRRAVMSKLRDMYVPTLKANYAVWPAVQVINFRLMPVQFQLVSATLPMTLLRPLCKLLSCSLSLSCLPLVSPGLRTSRSPTLPRRPPSQTQLHSVPTTSAWSRIGGVPCGKNGVSFLFRLVLAVVVHRI